MTDKKKTIVILFPFSWFPQTPTVMGLYDLLKQHWNVKILTLYNENRGVVNNPDFIYLNKYRNSFQQFLAEKRAYLKYQWLKIYKKLSPAKAKKYASINTDWLLYNYAMDKHLKKWPGCTIIAVDPGPAIFCQITGRAYHFLSTELQTERLDEMKELDKSLIRSVIIQTPRRFQILTIPGKEDIRNVFYIQNAPNFNPPSKRSAASNQLIFGGALWEGFGFPYCMNLVRDYKDLKLTLKGSPQTNMQKFKDEYASEIKEGRIIVDNTYSATDQFNELLLQHSIGFSFYDLNHPEIARSKAHYLTAPSGKMFTYFALGIPVIGSPGLIEIEEFEAGIIPDNYSTESLYRAVRKILSDYRRYSDNALKAAANFSFDRMAKPFIDFLLVDYKNVRPRQKKL